MLVAQVSRLWSADRPEAYPADGGGGSKSFTSVRNESGQSGSSGSGMSDVDVFAYYRVRFRLFFAPLDRATGSSATPNGNKGGQKESEISKQNLVAMYDSRHRPGKTCQGFITSLVRRSATMLAVIVPARTKPRRSSA
ncbi:MAG: hypothetical protein KAV82_09305 [Phycisphaerae bacterium]|nr:hypothetical protein [Phycisphaerae bacterium]